MSFPPRHAISRAEFFLAKAEECKIQERQPFEAYLEATIVFSRAALQRLEVEQRGHPSWEVWWQGLLQDPDVRFFRHERNQILKEGPPKIGQVIHGGPGPSKAAELYFYDQPGVRATDTVRWHLEGIRKLVQQADILFKP